MKTWIFAVVAIVIIGGGAYWWMQQPPVDSMTEQTTTGNATDTTSQENVPTSAIKPEPVKTTATTSNGFVVRFLNLDSTTAGAQPTNSVLFIENKNAQKERVNLTGWNIESKSTGLTYTIPTVTIRAGYKGTQPVTIPPTDVLLWPDEGVDIRLMGNTVDNYTHQTEVTSFSLYTGKTTWNTNHDTITIKDAQGKVLGTFIY